MKTLYLDCSMGAAGDMLTAALLELFADPEAVLQELNQIGIPGVRFVAEKTQKCGITGTHVRVLIGTEEEEEHHHHHDHAHHQHAGLHDIDHIISHLHVCEEIKKHVRQVYTLIARAESHVHGVPVEQIHFHEVGNMDAVADIMAVCYLINKLQPDKICASNIHVGCGQVQCAHGVLPVPAPATAYILQGVPIYGGEIRGELCTPTGAALLKHFVSSFGAMPAMMTEAIGYGMGKKDFSAANCVRAMLGHTADTSGSITELNCTIDDMTAEAIGFAIEQLRSEGALDVFTTAISMKKNRPGIQLTVLCKNEAADALAKAIFRYTTTNGIRRQQPDRYTLESRFETVQTPLGPVRKKISSGYGVQHSKFEYEDLARIARQQDLTLEQVRNMLDKG